MREQSILSSTNFTVPHTYSLLDNEIASLRSQFVDTQRSQSQDISSVNGPPTHGKTNSSIETSGSQSLTTTRKRVRLQIPAEKYPDYNFLGRLLGQCGATLKKLERDTGCKIIIRDRESIRKDKESVACGKPGWGHVFSDKLHVVIEVSDFVDDADANRILTRARDMVELLCALHSRRVQ